MLSVIVCLYNTKKEYFEECLDSIFTSTLENFEVIVINDGSSVDYSDVIEKYNVRYIKTENRGIMATRLYGISVACGDYICFGDSDDTVSFNYHAPMVEKAEKDGCDIVINDWAFNTERCRYFCKKDTTIAKTFTVESNCLKAYCENEGGEHSYFTLWNKVFTKSLMKIVKTEIEKLPLPDMKINYGEDTLMTFFAFKNAKKVENIHTGYYFYRIQPEQTVNVIDKQKLSSQVYSMTYVLDAMDKNSDSSVAGHLKKWRELMSRTHYSYAVSKGYDDIIPYIKERYRVDKLEKSTFKDGSVYADNAVIADNFEEIDAQLKKAYSIKHSFTANYDKRSKYVTDSINYINAHTAKTVTYSKGAAFIIPKATIKFKNKVVHNRFIYTIGMIFFKKGSKAREYLKKKI